jgi:cobalamin biosynthesis protein CbiD
LRIRTADFTAITGGTQATDGAYTICTFVLADSGTNLVLTTTSIKKISRVAIASVKKLSGVAIASVKKVAGLA